MKLQSGESSSRQWKYGILWYDIDMEEVKATVVKITKDRAEQFVYIFNQLFPDRQIKTIK